MAAQLIKLFSYLPLPLVRLLGWLVGGLLYLLPNRERANARVNLRLCFPSLTDQQRTALLRRVLRENSATFLEMPAAWCRPSSYWMKRCRIAHTLCSASSSSSNSSRRVPERSMSKAGKTRRSCSLRLRWSSIFPVPLNSS